MGRRLIGVQLYQKPESQQSATAEGNDADDQGELVSNGNKQRRIKNLNLVRAPKLKRSENSCTLKFFFFHRKN